MVPSSHSPMPRKRFNTNEQLTATRNRLMKMDQILGLTIDELSAKYRLHPSDVREGLSDAQKSGVLELIEKGVFDSIMPKALAVLEKHLDEGSLKAVELSLALFGAMKASAKAKNSFEVSFPSEARGVGIVALDQIRQERVLLGATGGSANAQKLERHDGGPDLDDSGGEDPARPVQGKRREH